jgi:hypothetical protein
MGAQGQAINGRFVPGTPPIDPYTSPQELTRMDQK